MFPFRSRLMASQHCGILVLSGAEVFAMLVPSLSPEALA